MAHIRIELVSDRESARRFSRRLARGEPFQQERELVLQEAWDAGHTPTGKVEFRGVSQGEPTLLKFDVEVTPGTHAG